jgi:RNA polymerase-associated protein RTF1
MSDVEDELLALAGGDVSSDEEDQAITHRDQSDSPAKNTASKGNARKTSGKKKHDESEEEGEAYV